MHYNELLLDIPFLNLAAVSLTSTVHFKIDSKHLADSHLICFFVDSAWQLNPYAFLSSRIALTVNFCNFVITLFNS